MLTSSSRPTKDPDTMSTDRAPSSRGRAAAPFAQELTAAILARNADRAVNLLVRARSEGWELRDLEQYIIAPAVTRLGQMWQAGRLDDSAFEKAGALAETVERTFRQSLVDRPLGGA